MNNEDLKRLSDIKVVAQVYEEQVNAKDFKRSLTSTILIILAVVALTVILVFLLFPVEKIDGNNLSPELDNGDICLCMKQPRYAKGDLVIFAYGDFTLVKRVIANEADYVDFDHDGKVKVNSKYIDEDYIIDDTNGEFEDIYPAQVPDSSYFVLSDNRRIMSDSRAAEIGFVKHENMIGKVILRFWPINKIKVF